MGLQTLERFPGGLAPSRAASDPAQFKNQIFSDSGIPTERLRASLNMIPAEIVRK
jgi:hypothetical protein